MTKAAVTLTSRARPSPRKAKNGGRRRRGVVGATFPHARMLAELGKRDTRAQRVAYYLNWAANEAPHQYQPFNEIVSQINAYGKLPRMNNDEVEAVRGGMHTVRKILQQQYDRDLDVAGGGARATVDDQDTAAVVLPKKMKRLRSARNGVIATHGLIDPNKIKNPAIKAYLTKSVSAVVKMIGTDDFEKKLLPPHNEDENG